MQTMGDVWARLLSIVKLVMHFMFYEANFKIMRNSSTFQVIIVYFNYYYFLSLLKFKLYVFLLLFHPLSIQIAVTNESVYGQHGYDDIDEPLMYAFFMAKGPIFRKNQQINPINTVDLYNLFCLILRIKCYKNDGSNDPNILNELFAHE